MNKYYILHNPHAGTDDAGKEACIEMVAKLGEIEIVSVLELDYHKFFAEIEPDSNVVICGGDGTLNRFVNDTSDVTYTNEIFYYPGGSGNDFYHDITNGKPADIIRVTEHVKDAPIATIKGKDYHFVNGIGYGIDGYCCQVGDEQKAAGKMKINYTTIAIAGVLFHYKPTGVTVTVDGVEHRFENAWLAPMMHGRYYGGGMMPTPDQVKNSGELSVMVFHNAGKLRLLTIFPSLFKGQHVKHTKQVAIFKGKNITVKYDEPKPLQVDGETILDVLECTVRA